MAESVIHIDAHQTGAKFYYDTFLKTGPDAP